MTTLTIQDVSRRSGLSIDTLRVHLGYLHAKAALWDARDRGDAAGEAESGLRVQEIIPSLEAVLR
jgi:MerR family copper efflux transcriptional regulator